MSEREVPARWRGTPAEPYWMNPEACARLVEEHGSQRAAGRAIGVSRGAITGWLNPEYQREYYTKNREHALSRVQRWNQANPGKSAERVRRWRDNPRNRSKLMRYFTIRHARRRLEITRQQAEELYNG